MYSSIDRSDACSNDHHGETDHGVARIATRNKRKARVKMILGDRTAVFKSNHPILLTIMFDNMFDNNVRGLALAYPFSGS
jgi:hypothetical protein